MNDLIAYIGIYILMVVAVFITVGLAWFLVVGRAIAKKNKVLDKELDAMTQRIKKRNELNGRATDHKIDLNSFDGGGWTGERDSKKPINLEINEPHPYYARETDDE